jgi:site-specific DNA-methyltransferase (adenine-specific)
MLEINKILLGDCLELMKEIPDKSIDLILADPPYGMGEDGGKFRDRKGGGHRILVKKDWDKKRPDKIYFKEIIRISKKQIIFGGNYFTDYLPVSRGWIYWRKLMGGDFSDGELAWTSFDRTLKEYTYCNKYKGKNHPTQKPVKLFEMILKDYSEEGQTILDPFSGSGTTAIACHNLKRNFICVEKDPEYHRKSIERYGKHILQERMF